LQDLTERRKGGGAAAQRNGKRKAHKAKRMKRSFYHARRGPEETNQTQLEEKE